MLTVNHRSGRADRIAQFVQRFGTVRGAALGACIGADNLVLRRPSMSLLAEALYELLRGRTALPEPRITYRELAAQLRERSDAFAHLTHCSRELYAALWEVGGECRRLGLPALPALVVRADTGRPGEAHHEGSACRFKGERMAEWRRELEAVRQARYLAR